MTVMQSSGGGEVVLKRPFNYDCSFAAGKARRKYFTEQIYYIFSPVWSNRSPCLPPSVYNSGSWSVRLKMNRQTSLRQR
ncbi:Hypp1242 [Branchiostoma lanceolatum]|uniref:Hypp1242 protein n=1 Tax=Branchiostoma lanceolatum TaxID=7740 RepID=A0A8J9ZHJ5_BRALA|nr:Hypp1242 [Branchiostoma lanceolatum]